MGPKQRRITRIRTRRAAGSTRPASSRPTGTPGCRAPPSGASLLQRQATTTSTSASGPGRAKTARYPWLPTWATELPGRHRVSSSSWISTVSPSLTVRPAYWTFAHLTRDASRRSISIAATSSTTASKPTCQRDQAIRCLPGISSPHGRAEHVCAVHLRHLRLGLLPPRLPHPPEARYLPHPPAVRRAALRPPHRPRPPPLPRQRRPLRHRHRRPPNRPARLRHLPYPAPLSPALRRIHSPKQVAVLLSPSLPAPSHCWRSAWAFSTSVDGVRLPVTKPAKQVLGPVSVRNVAVASWLGWFTKSAPARRDNHTWSPRHPGDDHIAAVAPVDSSSVPRSITSRRMSADGRGTKGATMRTRGSAVFPTTGAEPCAGLDVFFPDDYEDMVAVERARSVCDSCPIIYTCRAWAIANPAMARHGIWGGYTPQQRQAAIAR
ncbi:WhiB family transcriptional regulator [Streptomyces sp. NPDC088560]|uniref:WhiB family transcriptional regulator n=1 Tax=Streptomyces sp. NPDC088560 TaxID=3365868 RepID=UPI003816B941